MVQDSGDLMLQIKNILEESLFIKGRTTDWSNLTPLLGNIPELDSMAVMNVIAGLEKHFNIFMEDDEINADVFATLQSLTDTIQQKFNLECLQTVAY